MNTSSTIRLGVNIDHCATVRQARYRDYSRTCGQMVEPDPIALAMLAEHAGADGITVHLREDCRHIQVTDVERLRQSMQTRLNLEMAATEEMLAFALRIRPDSICLVPESREEITTEGGLDVCKNAPRIQEIITAMTKAGIATSLFVDPDPKQIEKAAELESPFIELHTGALANGFYDLVTREKEWKNLCDGAELAHSLGITVNGGHGINYINVDTVCTLPHLHELNIGHSILSRSLFYGIEDAVREMKSHLLAAQPACVEV